MLRREEHALRRHGWITFGRTRAEALRYYRKVTDTFQLQVAMYERVRRVEREGEGVRVKVGSVAHPMEETKDGLVPNFSHRFLAGG